MTRGWAQAFFLTCTAKTLLGSPQYHSSLPVLVSYCAVLNRKKALQFVSQSCSQPHSLLCTTMCTTLLQVSFFFFMLTFICLKPKGFRQCKQTARFTLQVHFLDAYIFQNVCCHMILFTIKHDCILIRRAYWWQHFYSTLKKNIFLPWLIDCAIQLLMRLVVTDCAISCVDCLGSA